MDSQDTRMPSTPRGRTRRAFLRGTLGTAALSLLAACAPAAQPSPTTPPAAPKPTEAPKPAAAASPAAAAQPAAAASPAAKPTDAPKPAAAASPAAAATQAAPAAKPATGDVLKVGLLTAYSRVFAALGESMTNGYQMYFDSVNNTAGGRRIELIKEDEENDPAVGLRKMRKLVEQDQVDVATGVISSAIALGLRDYLHENRVVFLCSNAGANALTRDRKSPYFFRTSFSNAQPSIPMGEYVHKNVAKRVVTAAADYAAGRESMAAFSEGFRRAGGTILAEVWPPFPSTDFAPFIEQIRQARPEAVYCFFAGADAATFVKQFDEFGLKRDVKLTGSGFLLEEDVLPTQGRAAIGGITSLHYTNTLDTPENRRFVEEYKRKFNNREPDVYAVQGYDSARVIVEAVNAVQGNTRDKDRLLQAIRAVSFTSPRGPFKFDPATQNPIINMYARETRDVGGKPTNVVIETFPDVKDPG